MADSVDENAPTTAEEENEEKCKICKLECVNGQEALGCDLCPDWFHRECIGYNKNTYKAIIQHQEVKWFCKDCNSKCKDTLSMIQLVMQKIEVLEGRNTSSEKKHAALEKRVLKLEKELEGRGPAATVVPQSGNDGLPPSSNSTPGSSSGNLSDIISAELREMKEVEERKNNIIITEIPEMEDVKEEDKPKLTALGVQEGENTEQVVLKLFDKLGVKNTTEIAEVKRIPQRMEGQPGGRPRKVLVKLADPKIQKIVLDKSKDLRRIGNGWETTFLSPDLTKKQREKAYQLRVERRRRTDAGETNLVIKNGAVVVRQPRNLNQNAAPFTPRSGPQDT